MKAKYKTKCLACQATIFPGHSIKKNIMGKFIHLDCAEACLEKPPAVEKPVTKFESFDKLYAMFDKANETLKYLKFTIDTGQVQIKVRMAGPTGKEPGVIYVGGIDYKDGWYGRLYRDGRWIQANAEIDERVADTISMLAYDPQSVITKHGAVTGNCCFCNSALTDEKSTTAGYGPTCAKHWGLPWGGSLVAKVSPGNMPNPAKIISPLTKMWINPGSVSAIEFADPAMKLNKIYVQNLKNKPLDALISYDGVDDEGDALIVVTDAATAELLPFTITTYEPDGKSTTKVHEPGNDSGVFTAGNPPWQVGKPGPTGPVKPLSLSGTKTGKMSYGKSFIAQMLEESEAIKKDLDAPPGTFAQAFANMAIQSQAAEKEIAKFNEQLSEHLAENAWKTALLNVNAGMKKATEDDDPIGHDCNCGECPEGTPMTWDESCTCDECEKLYLAVHPNADVAVDGL